MLSLGPINWFLKGPLWALKSLVLAVAAAFFFTCAPAVLVHRVVLPPAYQLKAEQPLADTALLTVPENEAERSHGAKLTRRLVGSFALAATHALSLHPYWPATIGGLVFLLCGILAGAQISGDRMIGMMTGLLFAGLYASAACFSLNWAPKPFDGVALGIAGLIMLWVGRPILLGAVVFLGCWTEERCILVALFAGALGSFLVGPQNRLRVWSVLAAAVVLYAVTRVGVGKWMEWTTPDESLMLISTVKQTILLTPLAAWYSFEGGWILLAIAAGLLASRMRWIELATFAASVGVMILATWVALDMTRTAAFGFPLVLGAIAILQREWHDRTRLQWMVGGAAALSLLAPSGEVIAGAMVGWIPPWSVLVTQKLLSAL